MGGQLAKSSDSTSPEDSPSCSQLYSAAVQPSQSTKATSLLQPPTQRHRRLQSLDRSLKVFLRVSNLPGLEYRLRLAGYYTVTDLTHADAETLCKKGFTGLMARRLLNALEDYIQKLEEPQQLAFHKVRRRQKITVEPTEQMKAIPTYGKQNMKRRGSFPENMAKKSRAAAVVSASTRTAAVRPAIIRLMSAESLKVQHLVFLPAEEDNGGTTEPGPTEEDAFVPEETDQALFSPSAVSLSSISSFGMPRRTESVPADFRYSSSVDEGDPLYWFLHHHVRHYSCPPSLASMETQPLTTVKPLMGILECEGDPDEVLSALQTLVLKCKSASFRAEAAQFNGVGAVVSVLQRLCKYPEIGELGCRILKNLTRKATPENVSLHPKAVSAIVLAMDHHPASLRVQLQGCLALGNIARVDPTQCRALLFEGGIQSIAKAMEAFGSDPGVQVAALAALGVALANVPEGRLYFISEHGYVLDLVISAMDGFPCDPQVQQYACGFFALLLTEVSAQVESGVVQLVVERVVVAMATCSHDHHVIHWGCKVLAHASFNVALGDWKLAARCCEFLTEALRTFSESSEVQTWAAYALYQMAMHHKIKVCDLLQNSDVVANACENTCPALSKEAQLYLQYLKGLASQDPVG